MPPPPPPPPPPAPGMGGPPPPPPPPGNMSSKPPGNRGALLTDISKGKQLKKAVTNDRSAPIVGKSSGGPGPTPVSGAPAIPGSAKPPGGLAPPVPGGNRARSNSDQGTSGMEMPPQLGGLFAAGIPKLKKRGGGVDTGANPDSSYTSDPETSRTSAPKPPGAAAPPPPSGLPPRPAPQQLSTAPAIASIANLRKTVNNAPRPNSSASMRGPPPPIGKKPPAPPGMRKPSMPAPQAPLPPPTLASSPPSSAPPPPAPPPPPPSTAPRPPINGPSRSQASPASPPPSSAQSTNGHSQNIAMQAAMRAAGQASPAAAPPPPPPPPTGDSHANSISPPPPSSVPPPPSSRAPSIQQPVRSPIDPASYTLAHNGGATKVSPVSRGRNSVPTNRTVINDPRWKFQDETVLPKPRDFVGGAKKYRAGRGSSVPLDLTAFT